MSETVQARRPVSRRSPLAGAELLARVQSLLSWSFSALVLYSFMVASRTGPLGASATADSFSLIMRPSPAVYFVVGLVVIWTIPAVLRRALDEPAAARIIRRSTIIVVAIVFGSMLLSVLWFALVQPETLVHGGVLRSPFPFATVEFTQLEVTPAGFGPEGTDR